MSLTVMLVIVVDIACRLPQQSCKR